MKSIPNPFTHEVTEGHVLYFCKTHGYQPHEAFFPWHIANKCRECKQCALARRKKHRTGTPEKHILAKLQEYLRRKGDHVTARRWDVGDVCTVIERCGVNLSSGSFCIVPKAPNLPYIPDNCILVTTTEARQRTAAWKKTTASTSVEDERAQRTQGEEGLVHGLMKSR